MTLRKKLWITIACLSVILCTLVTGTIAWLTDKTTEVKNTFTPSNISISLKETENLDFKMVPGRTITKDPKITIAADSEACWLFVKVEESANFDDFMTYAMADGWTALDSVSGVYYREVNTSENAQEFWVLAGEGEGDAKNGCVKVLSTITKADMQTIYDNATLKPTLTFTAYACQKEGFDTAAKAWAEVDKPTA